VERSGFKPKYFDFKPKYFYLKQECSGLK